jgi:FMN-dependent NADH-azoreductase
VRVTIAGRIVAESTRALPHVEFRNPSSLKAWIDHVVRAGKTFDYVGGAVEGLAKGKKAIRVLASGGIFSEGALEIMEFRGAVSAPDSGLHWN